MSPLVNRLDVLDWRRRVGALYAQVRSLEPLDGHAAWVAGRNELFAHHRAGPLLPRDKAGFGGLPVAPYDPALRFEVPIEQAEPLTREATTGTDGTVVFERVGTVALQGVGRLDVWWLDQYGGGLFLPLKDPGPGYGGGRYLLDTVKGADLGSTDRGLVVDLNFAYPPSCAYDPEWACPLPPPGNVVDAPVVAGELSAEWGA